MVTFLMQDGQSGSFPSFGKKGIFWRKKEYFVLLYNLLTLIFFLQDSVFWPSGCLSLPLAQLLKKQDRLLKGPILFTTLLNLKDIHIQLSHSADKLCWKEEAGSYFMWIYQCLFTLRRIFKISQGGSLSLFSKNDLTLKPSFQSCAYPRSKRICMLLMPM